MALAAGDQLGPYEIVALLGAGGMGEVYRARDPKLKRDVALKVLPEAFAGDAERMARFQREAEVLASLNHPNIAAIYGIEGRALVMELVEGESPKGPMTFDEAWKIASQMADALEYAHDRGIVHRDLKPANIKITPEGVVKLLDFGLAKALTPQSAASGSLENSPTLTLGATQLGVILGTASYMAPEQAKGKPVEKRADIWSFGVVLYELLAGERLFDGEDVSETLAQVLTKRPDFERVPQRARRILQSSLEKDPRQRLRHMGDARFLIDESPPTVVAPATPGRAPRFRALGWIAAGAITVLAGVALWAPWRTPPSPEQVRFQIPQPEKATFGPNALPALSPDGRKLAFIAYSGVNQVWIRSLDTLEARSLPGTEIAAATIFWSPDSHSIAFWTPPPQLKLKRVEIAGGPPQSLCDTPNSPSLGAWSRQGVIIFHTQGLTRVPAGGGACAPVTKIDPSRGESSHSFPSFLPDDRHFVYFRASSHSDVSGIYIGSLDVSPDQQSTNRILATESGAQFVPSRDSKLGYLLFTREGTLMAQPFDPGRLQIAGDAVPAAEQVAGGALAVGSFFTASATGVLAYRSGPPGGLGNLRLTWLDRQGKLLGQAADPVGSANSSVSFSPDGARAAFTRLDSTGGGGNQDLWLYEFERGTATRFTSRPSFEMTPVWSPDGKEIVFASDPDGVRDLYRKATNNATPEVPLFKSGDGKLPTDWSRDGRFLLFQNTSSKTGQDLFYLVMAGPGAAPPKPQIYIQTESQETQARFSPDARFVAYTSDFSGSLEVYLQTFPDPKGGRWQVSKGGGLLPHWRGDGKELFYVTATGSLMAVDVTLAHAIRIGNPRMLFQFPSGPNQFDVTGDGEKFVKLAVAAPASNSTAALTVVLNWQAGLKK
jgi:Tol biopolymer transport system component